MTSQTDRVRLCMVLGGHWAAQMGGAQFQAKCILDVLAEDGRFETAYVAHVVPNRRDWAATASFPSVKDCPVESLEPCCSYRRCISYCGASARRSCINGA